MRAQVGVDMCLDVHGDEALPYIFLAGNEARARDAILMCCLPDCRRRGAGARGSGRGRAGASPQRIGYSTPEPARVRAGV